MVARGRRNLTFKCSATPARTSHGERYAMNETTNVLRLRQPDEIDDPLTDVLRTGGRKLLAQAIEIEAKTFLAEMRA
ncbi:msr6276 [Mesorhizobium japonicum MAFF 303099]|uniref:Msr6276 protein n=1 Tax=Mesorhizobium japonicum (strain LMG 29417 / CECT 9101 / MAFF 303099) TaxID=266835 RepID=Q989U6_RHILO|nr:msr6276 [Mesorhizobium japonicum MAFF 303099]